jgi:hypothetical protein
VDLRKAKKQRQNQIYLTSTGILMEGDHTHWPVDECKGDSPVTLSAELISGCLLRTAEWIGRKEARATATKVVTGHIRLWNPGVGWELNSMPRANT